MMRMWEWTIGAIQHTNDLWYFIRITFAHIFASVHVGQYWKFNILESCDELARVKSILNMFVVSSETSYICIEQKDSNSCRLGSLWLLMRNSRLCDQIQRNHNPIPCVHMEQSQRLLRQSNIRKTWSPENIVAKAFWPTIAFLQQ